MTLESVFEESLFSLGNTMVFDSTEPISEWHSYLYELLIKKNLLWNISIDWIHQPWDRLQCCCEEIVACAVFYIYILDFITHFYNIFINIALLLIHYLCREMVNDFVLLNILSNKSKYQQLLITL